MALALPTLSLGAAGGGRPRTQIERLWLIGGSLVGFLLLLIGYFFFISPQRSDTSSVRSQVADAQAQNASLQARIAELRTQSKNLATYQAQLAQARQALPSTSGIPDFLRSLQALGNSTLTQVSSLTVGQPTNVSTVAAAAGTAAGTTGAQAGTTGGSGTTGTSGTAATGTGGTAGTATGAPATGGQIYALAITATVTGSPAGLDKFLDQLQSVQPRAVLISSLTEGSGTTSSGSGTAANQTSLQLQMQAFVAPANPGESAALAQASGR